MLTFKILIKHIDYGSADKIGLLVSDIDADLADQENDDISYRGGTRFLNELVNHPNNLVDYIKK